MTVNNERKLNWLYVISFLWGGIGIVCLCPTVFFIAFYDSPLGTGIGSADYLLILSVISFPIICIGASILIWFLKNKYKKLAFSVSLLPVLPLILFFATQIGWNLYSCGSFNCQRDLTLQEQGDASDITACALPVFDGGDGLHTTGCGVLVNGLIATGITETTAEAHNWQFSTQSSNQMTITIENDGNSCPQIIILDSSGKVIEGFEDENKLRLCPSGMTTTSFYYFNNALADRTYILRLFSPNAPGVYWLKIE